MIKKVFLSAVICCLVISCGKKGDPIYKESKIEIKIQKNRKEQFNLKIVNKYNILFFMINFN